MTSWSATVIWGEDEAGRLARGYLAEFFGSVADDGNLFEALNIRCKQMEFLKEILQQLSGGGPWDFVLTLALKIGAVARLARLSGFASQLVKLADAMNDISQTIKANDMLDKLNGWLDRLDDSLKEAYGSLDNYQGS